MLMFLILSLFVCCASSAPQVYQEYPREFERSQWAEDRIRRMEFSSTPQAFVEYPSESDRIKWAEERIKRTEAERERTIRIVGGSNAQPNQFRHAAALFLTLTNRLDSFCGGSIIHVNFILTAAHCLDDLVSIEVIAGTTNIFARGTPPYRQIVPAADTRQHPGYDRTTLRDDIGLLCLRRSVPSNSQIGTIRLPTRSMANMNFAARSVQERPFVIGWGRTADANQSLSGALQFIRLPVIEDRNCIDVYNTFYNYFNPTTNICLSGTQGSTCNGDSGGSISIVERGSHTLIGVVSYGSSKCEVGQPVALTRVTSYLDWISSNTQLSLA